MPRKGDMHPYRIFKTEDELWKAFEEYKADLKEEAKTWPKVQYVGKDGNRVEDYPRLPLTLEGFKRFCWRDYGDISNYFENSGEPYIRFKGICSRVRTEIRENQIAGGLLGFYNPSITQRLNGLVEKTDTTTNGEAVNKLTINVVQSPVPISNKEGDIKLE